MANEVRLVPAKDRIDWSLVAGICMLKDEADVIGANLEHLIAFGVKCFILCDDGSTDGSQEIVEAIKQRHDDVKIITIQGNGNFLRKRDIVRNMTLLARDVFNKRWAFCFDADDFLWLSHGKKIDLENSGADYILLPWLHINPSDLTQDYIRNLPDLKTLANAVEHKCKTFIKISDTVRMKGGQHNMINDRLSPAIGLDGMKLGMASVHFPIRSKQQMVSKYAMNEEQQRLAAADDKRRSKHRNMLRKLKKTDAETIYEFLVSRDKAGFLEYCNHLDIPPEKFDYLTAMICKEATSFPHPTSSWKSKHFPKPYHWTNRNTLAGRIAGSVIRRFTRIDSAQYRCAGPD